MVAGSGNVISFDRPLNLKTVDEVAKWAEDQFLVLERVLNEGAIYVRVVPISTEPPKPRAGMIVYALPGASPPTTGWDPGLGEGLYAYVNGAWELLS